MTELDRTELLARLQELLRTEYGLDLERGGARSALAEHVATRLGELERGQGLFDRVSRNVDGERERMIHAVTVRHTWFFRDPEQLDELAEFVRTHGPGRTLDVWVAGCATGEEAWTLVMIANELGVALRVLATDVDALAIAEARAARYDEVRLHALPPAMARYFRREVDGRWCIDRHSLLGDRHQVEFAVHNLCHPPPSLAFDVICCRNVLIYLETPRVGPILDQLRSRLRPHGQLVLGGADRLADPNTWLAAAPQLVALPLPEPIATGGEPAPIEAHVDDDAAEAERQFWIGLAHHRAGRPEQAIPAFRRANCLTPELWPACLFAALAHERRGDPRSARRCWTALTRSLERAGKPISGSGALIAMLPSWQSEALALARMRSSQTPDWQFDRPTPAGTES